MRCFRDKVLQETVYIYYLCQWRPGFLLWWSITFFDVHELYFRATTFNLRKSHIRMRTLIIRQPRESTITRSYTLRVCDKYKLRCSCPTHDPCSHPSPSYRRHHLMVVVLISKNGQTPPSLLFRCKKNNSQNVPATSMLLDATVKNMVCVINCTVFSWKNLTKWYLVGSAEPTMYNFWSRSNS